MTIDARAVALWKLLDDIDTLDDACRGNDAAFRKACYGIQRRRFEILSGEQIDAHFKLPATFNQSPAPQGQHRADAQATSGTAPDDPATTGKGAASDCPAPAAAGPLGGSGA